MGARTEGFDRAAAVTRSLLGYGVLAGVVYLVVSLVLALTREGFRLSEHALSLLMLGEGGWLQRANLVLVGVMVVAAAVGVARALRPARASRTTGGLLGGYGLALVLGGVFPPDPGAGFPPGALENAGTVAGVLHLVFGGVGFLLLACAAVVVGRWFATADMPGEAARARVAAVVIVVGSIVGVALATSTAGVVALWVAVLAGWAWLASASIALYRTVPHPDVHRRSAAPD